MKNKIHLILEKITKILHVIPKGPLITKFVGSYGGHIFSVTVDNGIVRRVRCNSKTYNKKLYALVSKA